MLNSSTLSAALAAVGVLISSMLGGPGSASVAAGATLFRDNFESHGLARWSLRQSATPERIQIVRPAPGGRRGRVVRFEVRYGDRVGGDVDSRAELAWTKPLASEGDSRFYSWWTYIPRSYPYTSGFQVLAQWKNQGEGSPPLELDIGGPCLALNAGTRERKRTLWRRRVARGRWHHMEVRITFSSNPHAGSIDIAFDGRQELSGYHVATLYPGVPSYFKMGLYRDAEIRPTGVIYDDDVTIRAARPDPASERPRRRIARPC